MLGRPDDSARGTGLKPIERPIGSMPTRRSFVAGCTGAATTGLLSGCGALDTSDGGRRYPDFTDWWYVDHDDWIECELRDYESLSTVPGLPSAYPVPQGSSMGFGGLERSMTYGFRGTLYRGSFSKSRFVEQLELASGNRVEASGSYHEYDVFHVFPDQTALVRDGVGIVGREDEIKTMVDAKRGKTTRLVAEAPTAGVMADRIGAGDWTSMLLNPRGETDEDQTRVARGLRLDVDQTQTTYTGARSLQLAIGCRHRNRTGYDVPLRRRSAGRSECRWPLGDVYGHRPDR